MPLFCSEIAFKIKVSAAAWTCVSDVHVLYDARKRISDVYCKLLSVVNHKDLTALEYYCLLGLGAVYSLPTFRTNVLPLSSYLLTWRWRQYIYIYSETSVTTYGATSQKTMRTQNFGLASLIFFLRGAVKWFGLWTGHDSWNSVNMVKRRVIPWHLRDHQLLKMDVHCWVSY